MNIAVISCGYVGFVSSACFAELGVEVTCVDVDDAKIGKLHKGTMPIYEPNLDVLVNQNMPVADMECRVFRKM